MYSGNYLLRLGCVAKAQGAGQGLIESRMLGTNIGYGGWMRPCITLSPVLRLPSSRNRIPVESHVPCTVILLRYGGFPQLGVPFWGFTDVI